MGFSAHLALRPPHWFLGEMAESAEGARLLSEYMPKRRIEGSNPSLSAIISIRAQPRLR